MGEVDKIKCKNLEDLDGVFDLSDPFVKLKLDSFYQDDQKTQTDEIGGNLNPDFIDEFFTFNVITETKLELELWDLDDTSKNDYFGKFIIPFTEKTGTNTYKLVNLDGKELESSCEVRTK